MRFAPRPLLKGAKGHGSPVELDAAAQARVDGRWFYGIASLLRVKCEYMAKKKARQSRAQAGPPKICEAERAAGPSGVVLCGSEIDLAQAVARRQAGCDVVVCGSDVNANRELAKAVEAAVGPWLREDPHLAAGPRALPHFHQASREPGGHSFYETGSAQRKARKQP